MKGSPVEEPCIAEALRLWTSDCASESLLWAQNFSSIWSMWLPFISYNQINTYMLLAFLFQITKKTIPGFWNPERLQGYVWRWFGTSISALAGHVHNTVQRMVTRIGGPRFFPFLSDADLAETQLKVLSSLCPPSMLAAPTLENGRICFWSHIRYSKSSSFTLLISLKWAYEAGSHGLWKLTKGISTMWILQTARGPTAYNDLLQFE